MKYWLGIAPFIIALAAPIGAEEASPPKPADTSDAAVLAALHHANQVEMEFGELAKAKGATREVRAYGDRLVRDHRFADGRIMRFAERNDHPIGPLPEDTIEAKQQAEHEQEMRDRLRAASGPAFDDEFLQMMADAHAMAIGMVKDAREKAVSPDLRSLLAKLQPILEQHQTIARELPHGNGGVPQPKGA